MATLVAAIALTAGTFLIPQNQPLANILTALNFALYAPHYFLPYEEMQSFRRSPEYTKKGVPSWARDNDDETTDFDTNFAAPTTHQSETPATDSTYKIQEVYLIDDDQTSLLTTTYEVISGTYEPRLALPGRPISVTVTLGEDYVPSTTASSVPTSTSAWYNWAVTKMPVLQPPIPVVPEVNTSDSAGWLTIIKAIFSGAIHASIEALWPGFEKLITLLELFTGIVSAAIMALIEALQPEFDKLMTLLNFFIYMCVIVPIYTIKSLLDFASTIIAHLGSELWFILFLLAPWVIIVSVDVGYQPLTNAIVHSWLWLTDKLNMIVEGFRQRRIDAFLDVLRYLEPYYRSVLAAVLFATSKFWFGFVFPLVWLVDKLTMFIDRFNQRIIGGLFHEFPYLNPYYRCVPAVVLFNTSRFWVQDFLSWENVSVANLLVCALVMIFRFGRASQRVKGAVARSIGCLLHKMKIASSTLMKFSTICVIAHSFGIFVTEFTDWELESNTDTLLVGCAGILLLLAPFVFCYLAWKYAVVQRVRGFSVKIQHFVITLYQAIVSKFQEAYVATRAFAASQIQNARLKAKQALSKRTIRVSLAVAIALGILTLIEVIADILEEFLASRIGHITFASSSHCKSCLAPLQSLFAFVEPAFNSIGDSCVRFSNASFTEVQRVFPGPYTRITGPIVAMLQTFIVEPYTRIAGAIFATLQHSIVEPYMRVASPVWAALQSFTGWLVSRVILKWRRRTHNMVCSNAMESFMATVALNQYVPFGRSTLPNLAMALMTLICCSLDIARYTIIPMFDKILQVAAALCLSQSPCIALRTALAASNVVRVVQDWRLLKFRNPTVVEGDDPTRQRVKGFLGWVIEVTIFCVKATVLLVVAWYAWPCVFGVWDWLVVVTTVLFVLRIQFWVTIWSNLPVGVQDAARAGVDSAPFHMIQRFADYVVGRAQKLWQTVRQSATYVWKDMTNTLPVEDTAPLPESLAVLGSANTVTPELAHTPSPPTTPTGEVTTAGPHTPEPTLPIQPNAEPASPQDSNFSTTPEPRSDADMPPNDSGIGGSSPEWKTVRPRAGKARSTNANSVHSGSSGESTPRAVPDPQGRAAINQGPGRYGVLAGLDNGDENYGGEGSEET